MGECVLSGEKHPVKHGEDPAGGVGVVDRRAEEKGVRLPGLLDDPVDDVIIKHAFAGLLLTGPAGGAVQHRAAAEKQELRLRTAGLQNIGGFPQGCAGTAFRPGAAVEQQDFHVRILPFPVMISMIPQIRDRRKREHFIPRPDSDKKKYPGQL